jgi:hypothetical protein
MTCDAELKSLGTGSQRTNLALLGVVLAVVVGSAATADGQTGLLGHGDFTYSGAFRLDCGGDACAYNLNDLGVAPNGGLWVTDHVYDYAVRRIDVPVQPLVTQVYADLPAISTLEGPLDTGGCPGSSTDISGVEPIGTDPATTCRDWYNVTGAYTPSFYRRIGASIEEVGPRTPPYHPNKYGAYLFDLPIEWVTGQGLGTKTFVTGFSREAGANGGSQGPALFAFDPDNPVDAVDLVYYREIYPGCPAQGLCDFPGYESPDSWMGAEWVWSTVGRAILVAGVKAGSTCYGTGATCGDPCRASQGYHGYPYTGRILFYDPADLEARLAGSLQPYEVLPYAEWDPTELWQQECPNLGGLSYDEASGRLYVAERLAGPDGRGIIHVYLLRGAAPIFADGFEDGGTGRWSTVQP